ncbi:uncharacterized protein LOC112693534 [Sipha flava]|uniref:Uncharacterized protein LOC112693534 n=1 Tax=Sipha flava TaxID=143950 RepID=A0A8B8GP99_9HEMI|nr:uncharacterized protein LOC112693534 [Sipha flava]
MRVNVQMEKEKKKRICKVLPKDRNNGTQQKKLSKNTAKKRKRAQQMESTTSVIETVTQYESLPENTHSKVVPTEIINSTDRPHNSGQTTSNNYKSSDHNGTKKVEIKTNVIISKDKNEKVLEDLNMPKIQTKGNGNCVIKEVDENLFNLPRDVALAHCIAEDLRMERGVAVQFKRYFGGIGQLMDQKLTVGDVGVVVKNETEYAFYLVTKNYCNGTSTMLSLSHALKSLVKKMQERKINKLGIPQIGCGTDGLEWSKVKPLIEDIFAGSGIEITVCVPTKIFYRPSLPQMKVYITPKKLLEINNKLSDLLLLIDIEQIKSNHLKNDIVDAVNLEYPSFKEKLMKDIKTKALKPGDVTSYFIKKENIHCLFTSQSAYYSSLEKGFLTIKNYVRRSYRNFAIQSGPIKPTAYFKHISRIVLLLRSIIYGSELWLCGDSDQTNEKVVYEHYCKQVFEEIRLSTKSKDRNYLQIGKRNNPLKINLQRR